MNSWFYYISLSWSLPLFFKRTFTLLKPKVSCFILFIFFPLIFKIFFTFFIVVQVQLSPFPPAPPFHPSHSPLPTLGPTPLWFCPCVLYTCSWKPFPLLPPLSPLPSPLVTVSLFLGKYHMISPISGTYSTNQTSKQNTTKGIEIKNKNKLF